MKLIYLAHPISAFKENGELDKEEMILNEAKADALGQHLASLGYAMIVPGNNTRGWYKRFGFNYDWWLSRAFAIIARCDAIFFAPGWEHSKGCLAEMAFAQENHIKGFTEIELLKANVPPEG